MSENLIKYGDSVLQLFCGQRSGLLHCDVRLETPVGIFGDHFVVKHNFENLELADMMRQISNKLLEWSSILEDRSKI